jgi:hypothetical protein
METMELLLSLAMLLILGESRREGPAPAGTPASPVRKHGAGTAGSAERTRPYMLEWFCANEVPIRKCPDRKNALILVTIDALDNEGGMDSFYPFNSLDFNNLR